MEAGHTAMFQEPWDATTAPMIGAGFEAMIDAALGGELEVSDADRIARALEVIYSYAGTDGGHHKQWVIDQVVRALVPDYKQWVKAWEAGEDGPQTYSWDEGIAP